MEEKVMNEQENKFFINKNEYRTERRLLQI